MFTRILSPLSAEPNLALARAYIRRTPVERLSIVYQIEPQYNPPSPAARPPAVPIIQNNTVLYSELLNRSWAHAQLALERNLGQELYMDSILMGGIDGEPLAMTLDMAQESEVAVHMPGGLLDVSG